MSLILDATAANRHMWGKGDRGHSNLIVYMDYETKLTIPPDIFADFKKCPFRDDVFALVIFDTQYHYRNGDKEKWKFYNPDGSKKGWEESRQRWKTWGHYGCYTSRRELIINLVNGAAEFLRIAKRLAFKWGTGTLSLHKALSCLTGWKPVYSHTRKSQGYHYKSLTSWTVLEPKRGKALMQVPLQGSLDKKCPSGEIFHE